MWKVMALWVWCSQGEDMDPWDGRAEGMSGTKLTAHNYGSFSVIKPWSASSDHTNERALINNKAPISCLRHTQLTDTYVGYYPQNYPWPLQILFQSQFLCEHMVSSGLKWQKQVKNIEETFLTFHFIQWFCGRKTFFAITLVPLQIFNELQVWAPPKYWY